MPVAVEEVDDHCAVPRIVATPLSRKDTWLEAELADQLQDHRFFGPIVTCHQHERLHRIVGGIAHIACARRVERLEDESARCPACDPLASRGVESENEL
jgi:hypothetical protein